MKTIRAFIAAFYCMTIHRALRMSHDQNNDHIITCKYRKCDQRITSRKNAFLTGWYFQRNQWYTPLLIIPMFIVGGLNFLITRREGVFEHPPEHDDKIVSKYE